MSTKPILVTGATGKTGRRVVRILRSRGLPYRAACREGDVSFDWDDEATWPDTVRDVEVAYLVIPDLGSNEATAKAGRFAKLMALAGGRRVVMVSTPDDMSDFHRQVKATESAIKSAGLALTSLRLRWFYQNFSEDFLHPAVMSGSLRLPAGNGMEAFIDADDIAAVAVEALLNDSFAAQDHELTGPRLMSFGDIAADLSRATGTHITYAPVTPEQFVAEQIAEGVDVDWANLLCNLYQVISVGTLEATSLDVGLILGRPPRDFADFATKAAREGAWW